MKDTNTGGPAFPTGYDPEKGMTLRDYFAAKAMQAGINTYHHDEEDLDEFCRWAYVVADEMLKARDAKT
jgi:hypothetical protein